MTAQQKKILLVLAAIGFFVWWLKKPVKEDAPIDGDGKTTFPNWVNRPSNHFDKPGNVSVGKGNSQTIQDVTPVAYY